jgi:hypothetical protein
MSITGPSDSEKRELRFARTNASTESWTNFIERFPNSENIPEAQASIKLLSRTLAANTKSSIDPRIIDLRAELRSLDEQWLALNRGKMVTPQSTTKVASSVPSLTEKNPTPLKTDTVTTVSKPKNSPSVEKLSPEESERFTIQANATREQIDDFIRQIDKAVFADVINGKNTDRFSDALFRIPVEQLPALIAALKNYPQNPFFGHIMSAIIRMAQPHHADLIIPLLREYPEFIKIVERCQWHAKAKVEIIAWLEHFTDLSGNAKVSRTYVEEHEIHSYAAPFVRALLANLDPQTYPLITKFFLGCSNSYTQRNIYFQLEKIPASVLNLDDLIAEVWKKGWKPGSAYNDWEALATIAAQHGHADALAAVIAHVSEQKKVPFWTAKAKAWLAERTDSPTDPAKAAAWLAAGPVFNAKRKGWYSKGSFTTP